MEWGFHHGMRGFHVEEERGFRDGAGSCAVDTWGFHVEGEWSFMVVQNKSKLFHFGPGRAHPSALLDGHGRASHIRGPALALLKAVQSLPVVPCPVRSDPAKRIVRKNGPLS